MWLNGKQLPIPVPCMLKIWTTTTRDAYPIATSRCSGESRSAMLHVDTRFAQAMMIASTGEKYTSTAHPDLHLYSINASND